MADDSQYAFDIAPPGAEHEDDAAASSSTLPTTTLSSSTSASKPSKKRKADRNAAPATAPAPTEEEEPAAPSALEEERPLSHKEKRLAKKRKLAAEAAGELLDDAAAPAASSKPAAPAPTMIGSTVVGNTAAKSAHGIWVGNLNFATHARELLAWFADKGLKEVMRINMPNGKRQHENNRGFAYLDFPSETDVTIAVGLSEQHLDGRKLLIKSSSDYSGRPAPSASSSTAAPAAHAGTGDLSTLPPLDPSALDPSAPLPSSSAGGAPGAPQTLNRTARKILDRQKNPPGPTLFIGNLGFETTVDDIRDMFDRNQVRAAEWAPKVKGKKGEKTGKRPEKGKGKAREEDGSDAEAEGEKEVDMDRDDDDSDSSDADEEEKEAGAEEGGEKAKKRREKKDKDGKKEPLDFSQAKDAGIRKIRLGTFEDTGKCKGWCFVDFHLPAQATRALLNLRNHTLNGRKLNVEYASADAVRRGGLGSRAAGKAARVRRENGGGEGEGQEGGDRRNGGGKRREREWDDGNVRDLAQSGGFQRDGPPHGRQDRRRGDGFGGGDERRPAKGGVADGKRAKPGAALANAQRASEAIVQSQGRKTTFD
ncbi:hypothetical protein JCM8097_005332 [Rhodosporidiobolus ruineniae]